MVSIGFGDPDANTEPAPFDQKILRIRIRRPQGEPRYYAIPGSNMDCMLAGSPGRLAVVVESELDLILLDRFAGDMAAIIALGNSSRKPDARAYEILEKSIADPAGIGCRSGRDWAVEMVARAI